LGATSRRGEGKEKGGRGKRKEVLGRKKILPSQNKFLVTALVPNLRTVKCHDCAVLSLSVLRVSLIIVTRVQFPVASLGWVSPGAATEGVTPIFSLKTDDLFSHHRPPVLQCHPYLFSHKNWPFLLITVTSLISLGCHPAPFFYLSDLVCPLFVVNLPTKNLYGCHPLEGVTRGVPTVTPLSVSAYHITLQV